MKRIVAIFALFSVLFGTYASEVKNIECPPEDAILPCVCSKNDLRCDGIVDVEVLRKVFGNTAGHTYEEIFISNSSFQYIPKEMLDQVQVRRLVIKGSTFISLFDSPPQQNSLLNIEIISSKIYRPSWKIFSGMPKLEGLYMMNTPAKTLDQDFNDNMPKNLKVIYFDSTGTKSIKSGAFKDLSNLLMVKILKNNLSVLTRDVLPVPYIGLYLEFSDNHLTSLPDDFFTQMPDLMLVDFRNNNLTEIPEAIKASDATSPGVWLLDGNPINCDCKTKSFLDAGLLIYIQGTCASPDALRGRNFNSLSVADFDC